MFFCVVQCTGEQWIEWFATRLFTISKSHHLVCNLYDPTFIKFVPLICIGISNNISNEVFFVKHQATYYKIHTKNPEIIIWLIHQIYETQSKFLKFLRQGYKVEKWRWGFSFYANCKVQLIMRCKILIKCVYS